VIEVERPAPLPVKPESVAPVVAPPVTEAAGFREPPKPASSSLLPATLKPECPAPLPGKIKREPVVDSGRAAEAAYQQEIEASLAVVFRQVSPAEQADLEMLAGGKLLLLERLRSFQQRALRFSPGNRDLLRSAIANPGNLLQQF
jgi:hypothetical protein